MTHYDKFGNLDLRGKYNYYGSYVGESCDPYLNPKQTSSYHFTQSSNVHQLKLEPSETTMCCGDILSFICQGVCYIVVNGLLVLVGAIFIITCLL